MLSTKYQLSEECVSGSGVFSESGRNELLSSLRTIPSDIRRKVGVYTCPPYAFMIGIYNQHIVVLDTHPINAELGGNGNGIMVATHDRSPRSCRLISQWILKRLKMSGVDQKTPQSLAWFIEVLYLGMIHIIHHVNKL